MEGEKNIEKLQGKMNKASRKAKKKGLTLEKNIAKKKGTMRKVTWKHKKLKGEKTTVRGKKSHGKKEIKNKEG